MAVKIGDAPKMTAELQNFTPTEKTTETTGQQRFQRQLTSLSQEAYEERIRGLIDNITKQGDLLGKRADIKEFQKYREMVTELLNETVSNSYAFQKNETFDMRGRHKVYAVIKRVNKELDTMASELLNEENNNLRILDQIDDIRGMLVDLFL